MLPHLAVHPASMSCRSGGSWGCGGVPDGGWIAHITGQAHHHSFARIVGPTFIDMCCRLCLGDVVAHPTQGPHKPRCIVIDGRVLEAPFLFVASLGLLAFGRWAQWCKACGLAWSARLRAMYKCVPDSSSMACLTAGSGKLANRDLSVGWGKAGGQSGMGLF